MNYEGVGRTNYVTVENLDGLKNALTAWPVSIATDQRTGKIALLGHDDAGWPTWGLDENDNEVALDIGDLVMPFVADGEVLVLMETGHEGRRYLSGSACAWIRRGEEVLELNLSLAGIYQMASDAFGVPMACITSAEY